MSSAVLALGAAAVFGTGTALQHRAASGISRVDMTSRHLLVRLVRSPGWLAGICLSGIAFVLHVAALHHGSLSLVQPIVVTTIVFAVFVRSGLEHSLPDRAEIVWAVCTWVGLTLFVAMVGTRAADSVANDRTAGLCLIAGAAAAVVASAVALRLRVPARRGFLLGVAAGILYGLTAGLIKMTVSQARSGVVPLLHHWSAWLVAPAGLGAFLLSQWAFQASRLSVSAPVLNIVDVLVAVAFGSAVFGDRLFSSPGHLVVELAGALMMGVGVWRLVKEDERLHESRAGAGPPDRLEAPKVTSNGDVS